MENGGVDILLVRRLLLTVVFVKELERLGVVTTTAGGLLVTSGFVVGIVVPPPSVLFVEVAS